MKILFFFLTILLIGCDNSNDKKLIPPQPIVVKEEDKIDGEILYKNNCANCHKCDRDFVGPDMRGSLQRWGNDKKAMYAFIRNPAASNTPYAKQLKQKWKASGIMTAFQFTDKQLDAIMKACDYSHLPQK
jgi:cytochrome c551/c552